MTDWQFVKIVILTNQWQLINVNSELIRVSHLINDSVNTDTRFLKAAIAKGTLSYTKINTYNSQLLSYKDEPEIFFYNLQF